MHKPALYTAGAVFAVVAFVHELQIRPQNALGGKLAAGGLVALGKKIDQPSYHLELPAGTGRKEG